MPSHSTAFYTGTGVGAGTAAGSDIANAGELVLEGTRAALEHAPGLVELMTTLLSALV